MNAERSLYFLNDPRVKNAKFRYHMELNDIKTCRKELSRSHIETNISLEEKKRKHKLKAVRHQIDETFTPEVMSRPLQTFSYNKK